jgi:hypothetical protein
MSSELMKRFYLLILLSFPAFAQICPKISPELKKIVDSHVRELQAEILCEGTFASKSGDIETILYSIGGPCKGQGQQPSGSCGNMVVQYLAAIVNSKKIHPYKINGFLVKKMNLDKNMIHLQGKKLHKNDPRCCPSIDVNLTIKITENGFTRL